MSSIVITNNLNLLSGVAQTIAADDPYKDLSIADRLKNSLKAFSDVQVSLASDYQSGGFLNFGVVDGQTYRVTLDNYDVWFTGSFSQFGSQISKIYVVLPGGANYLMLQGQISYSGLPFFTSMVNGSKLTVIESGATNLGFQTGFSSSDVLVDINSTYSNGTLTGSINQISSGIFSKNSSSFAYFDQLSGGDIKFTVSNIGTVTAQATVTGTKFTNAIISIVDRQNLTPIDTVSISNAFIDVTKKSSLALNSDGSDSYVLQGSLPSRIESGAGNDTITGSGFDDKVFGGDGKDSLIGGAGSDYLDGGLGDDTMNGGAGDDIYVVDSVGDVILGEENSDGNSAVQVKGAINFVLASNQRINLLSAGELSYVSNTITSTFTNTNAANIKGNDFNQNIRGNAAGNKLEGAGGDDGIDGKTGNDTLDGGDGNDWLDGGVGNDILSGGLGDDTLWGDYGQFDQITLAFGSGGKDSILGGAGNDSVYMQFVESSYTVSRTDTTLVLTNKTDANSVTTIDRTTENGVEFISFNNASPIALADLLAGAATTGNDNLFQRVSLAGTGLSIDGLAGNDTITGTDSNAFGDSLFGGDGTDSLVGLAGNDVLNGGAGNDTMNGGSGGDIYIVDSVNDFIIETTDEEPPFVNGIWYRDEIVFIGAINYVLANGQRVEWLRADLFTNTNATNIKGNEFSQQIDGNAAANKLEGAGGYDSLFGFEGNDTLDGGEGQDYLQGGSGNDLLIGGAGYDEFKADWGDYNFATSTIDSGGKDTIIGGADSDAVYMQFYESNYTVSRTDKAIILTNRNDSSSVTTIDITQANGVEYFVFASDVVSSVPISVWWADLIAGVASAEDDVLYQRGSGSFYYDGTANVFTSSGVSDAGFTINGGDGNDLIFGTMNSDSLVGDAGKDSLSGGDGNDYLDGGQGDDTIIGGKGGDLLLGGEGNDVLEVGANGYSQGNFPTSISLSWGTLTNPVITSDGKLYYFYSNSHVNRTFLESVLNSGNDIIDSQLLEGVDDGRSTLENDLTIALPNYQEWLLLKSAGLPSGWFESFYWLADSENGVGLVASFVVDHFGPHADEAIHPVAFRVMSSEFPIDLDVYDGGVGSDKLDLSEISMNIRITLSGEDLSSVTYNGTTVGKLKNIENLSGGYGNDNFEGDSKRNILSGGEGSDSINGGENNDVLQGDLGNDLLEGGNGRDYLNGGEGNDYLDGGSGVDLLMGGAGDDIYVIDSFRDVIIEHSGWDTIKSQNLNEINLQRYRGIEAAEYTGSGDVTLIGNSSNNSLKGSSGADTLIGKFGNDTLTGAGGSDKFVFNAKLDAQFNFDQITDFSTGSDKLVIDKTIFTRLTSAVQGSNLIIGTEAQDSDDYLIYDSNTQTLFYDADGNAVGAKVAFAQLIGVNSLSSADFSLI